MEIARGPAQVPGQEVGLLIDIVQGPDDRQRARVDIPLRVGSEVFGEPGRQVIAGAFDDLFRRAVRGGQGLNVAPDARDGPVREHVVP